MSDNSIKIKIELDHIVITKDQLKSVKKQIFDKFSDIPIKQAVDEILKHSLSICRSALYQQAILKALEEWSGEEIIVYQITRDKKLRRIKSEREQISLLSPSTESFLNAADQFRDQLNQVRSFRKHHLRRCRQEYKETKNPLFVWNAYYRCQQWEIPVPKWVSDYLTDTAMKMLKTSKDWHSLDKFKDTSAHTIPLALGFAQGGGSSKFRQYNRFIRNQEIYYRILKVQEEMEAEKKAGWIKPRGETEFVRVQKDLLKKEKIKLSIPSYKKIFKKEKGKTFLIFIEDDFSDFD